MASTSLSGSDGIKRDWVEYVPLHRAILRGDWVTAHEIISTDKDALTIAIDLSDTTLHVAIELHKNIKFLDNLLNMLDPESLPSIVNEWKQNPLHRAAVVGNTEASKMLVDKNPHLLFLLDAYGDLPIHKAVYNIHQTTYLYLVGACKQYISLSHRDGYYSPFEGICGAKLLTNVISTGYLDVAYELINDYPHMAVLKNGTYTPLESLSNKRDAFLSGRRYNFYQRFVYSHVPTTNYEIWNTAEVPDIENQLKSTATKCTNSFIYSVIERIHLKVWEAALLRVSHIKHLQEDKRKHRKSLTVLKCILEEVGKLNTGSDVFGQYALAFDQAAINDTSEVVDEIMEYFPQAAWTTYNDYHLSQLAVIYRCENVYNFLVHKMSLIHNEHLHKIFIDKEGNNLLHLAGKLAPIDKLNMVSGAALQMQRELQWFQAVENYMRPSDKEVKNKKQETPFMMFRREHTDLRKEGEEWMKKTADSYTITAALIITIVFAAAITVPGGTNGDNGKAIYASKPTFIIFAISDAISLFTSTTSLLLFLSILTTRYRDEDFLYKLPKRLILGLAMLFLSVTSLMVAFSATLYLMMGDGRAWILIPIASLACLPIASFVTLQLPLLFDLIYSTYGGGVFGKTTKTRKTRKIE